MNNLSDISLLNSGPPEITGFSLNVALKVLEGTGNLGQKFTSQIGLAEEFEPTGFYPYQLIVDLYRMVFNFLGWQGLFLMGSKQTPALIAARGHSRESLKLHRKLPQTVNNMKIETSISLEMRDEEVEIYGKPNCWDIGRG